MEIEIRHEEDDMMSELYNASMNGCTTTLDRLILNDPLLLNRIPLTSLCETPLHISVLAGHLDFSTTLLLKKPQLAVELDSHKRCPLHLASAAGHIEITQALLDSNDSACLVPDQDGRLPLHYAAMRGRVEIVKKLINVQPDSIKVVSNGGETVLHLCVRYNQLEALKLLMEFVSDEGDFLKSKDHEGGNTIVHLAVMLKQIETIKYLLSMSKAKDGANVSNHMGFTALEVLDHFPKDFKGLTIQNILMDAGVERAKNQNDQAPSGGHNEPEKPTLLKKTAWSKFLDCMRYKGDWIEETRGSLMVVATVITTMTYQPALSPPGGLWQTNTNDYKQGYGCNKNTTCEAGTSVLVYQDESQYITFMFLNNIAFTASLSVIFLLISGIPLKNKIFMGLLTYAMCSTVLFVGLTYAQAFRTQIPEDRFNRYGLLISVPIGILVCLMSVVELVHTIRLMHWLVRKIIKLVRKIIKLISTCVKALLDEQIRLTISKMGGCNSY